MRHELIALQPAKDLVGHALGLDDLRLQSVGEELMAIAAAALCPVEGDVGVDQQALRIEAVPLIHGDAYAGTEAALVAMIEDRLPHPTDDAVGQHRQLVCFDVRPTDDDKLDPSDTGNEILGTDGRCQHS